MALKFRHAGQACITANRVYVQRGVYEKFGALLAERVNQLKIGHGIDKETTMGPVTVPQSLSKVASQIEDAKKHGAKVLTGGERIERNGGYYFQPTIIKDAGPGMLVTTEETFGPLLALFPFDTEEEAVTAANNTSVSHRKGSVTLYIDIPYADEMIDGPVVIFLHQECRSNMAFAGELGSWHDRDEHWKRLGGRVSFRRHQGLWFWKGVGQGRRGSGVHDYEDWDINVRRAVLNYLRFDAKAREKRVNTWEDRATPMSSQVP